MAKNPKWTEDELILALDLFGDLPSGQISAKNDRVIDLSNNLNRLRSAEVVDGLKYRNPNGAALKLHNFSRFDSNRSARGMTHGGKLEEVLWKRYQGKRDLLKRDAQAIYTRMTGTAQAL